MTIVTEKVYELIRSLPRFEFPVQAGSIPPSGIYVFFERDEEIELENIRCDRITRVGTHTADGRLPKRLQQHYGNIRSLGGNKNASAFRRHLGGALLCRSNPSDPRIDEWLRHGGKRPGDVEALVSQTLRENYTFTCIPVASKDERRALERGLIGLLSQHPVGLPSTKWLGNHARAPEVRKSGLWNVIATQGTPLTLSQFDRLQWLATQTW